MRVYGINPVLEALRAKRVTAVRVSQRADDRLVSIVRLAEQQGIPVRRAKPAELDRFAKANFGRNVLALAVRWILDHGPMIALWGARRPEQIAEVGTAMGWSLDAAAMREIDRILDRTVTNPVGPEFMAPPAPAGDRAAA